MWKPQGCTTLWSSMALYRDSFTFFIFYILWHLFILKESDCHKNNWARTGEKGKMRRPAVCVCVCVRVRVGEYLQVCALKSLILVQAQLNDMPPPPPQTRKTRFLCVLLQFPYSLPWITQSNRTATGYGLAGLGVGVRVLVGERIFSSPRRSDRFRGPPSLLSNG
jgi:hypothetical protein